MAHHETTINVFDPANRELLEFKDAFSKFDKGNEEMNSDDLGALITELGFVQTESEIFDLIDEVDPEKTGVISFSSFMEILAPRYQMSFHVTDLYDAFRIFDKFGTGFVGPEEVAGGAEAVGDSFTEDEIEEIIREGDKDKDGKLSQEEFVKLIMKTS